MLNTNDNTTVDNRKETTALYQKIYDSFFKFNQKAGKDELRPDFDNAELRTLIIMLLIANKQKINPYASFMPETSDPRQNIDLRFELALNYFHRLNRERQIQLILNHFQNLDQERQTQLALNYFSNLNPQQQVQSPLEEFNRINPNYDISVLEFVLSPNFFIAQLPNQQIVDVEGEQGQEYMSLFSGMSLQPNYMTFFFKPNTISFRQIIKIALDHNKKIPEALIFLADFLDKKNEKKNQIIENEIQHIQSLLEQFNKAEEKFKSDSKIETFYSSLKSCMPAFEKIFALYNFIDDEMQKTEIETNIDSFSKKLTPIEKYLEEFLAPEMKLQNEISQLEKKLNDLNFEEEEKFNDIKKQIQEKKKQSSKMRLQTHFSFLRNIQELQKLWNETKEEKKVPELQMNFDTRDSMKECSDLISFLDFTPDEGYPIFMELIILPIIQQLAFSAISKTSPELITKILSRKFDSIVSQRIQQILNDASQNNTPLPDITLENLLDENLITVYEVWPKKLAQQQIQEKINKIIQIAQTTQNPEVIKAIMEQERFKSDSRIISAILENPYHHVGTLFEIFKVNYNNKTGKQIFDGIIQISQQPNNNRSVLSECMRVLLEIYNNNMRYSGTIYYQRSIQEIETLSQNPNIDVDFLSINSLTKLIRQIKSENILKLFFNKAERVLQNSNTDAQTLSYLGDCLEDITQSTNNPEIQQQCINVILQISKDSMVDEITLSSLRNCLGNIAKSINNPKIQQQCINVILQISKDSKANAQTLSNLGYCLGNIAKSTDNLEIKKQCINVILQISKDSRGNVWTLSHLGYSLRDIAKSTDNSEIQQQCIDAILQTLEDSRVDTQTLLNLGCRLRDITQSIKDLKIQQQCINIILQISKDLRVDVWILSYLGCSLRDIAKSTDNSEIQQQCINVILQISKDSRANAQTLSNLGGYLRDITQSTNNPEIKKQCDGIFNAIFERVNNILSQNSNTDAQTLSYLGCSLGDIAKSIDNLEIKKQCINVILQISKDSRVDAQTLLNLGDHLRDITQSTDNPEIQQQCINVILQISQNSNTNALTLSFLEYRLRDITQSTKNENLKSYCEYAGQKLENRKVNEIIPFEEFLNLRQQEIQAAQNPNSDYDKNFESVSASQSPKSEATSNSRKSTEEDKKEETKAEQTSEKEDNNPATWVQRQRGGTTPNTQSPSMPN